MYSLFRDSHIARGSLSPLFHLKLVWRDKLGWDQPNLPNMVKRSGIHLVLVERQSAGAGEAGELAEGSASCVLDL